MDLWSRDAIDLVGPAFVKVNSDGTGSFRFIAVEGYLDCRRAEPGDGPIVEFTWDSNDEADHASGRGWIPTRRGRSLHGHIFIDAGFDSSFSAVPDGSHPSPAS